MHKVQTNCDPNFLLTAHEHLTLLQFQLSSNTMRDKYFTLPWEVSRYNIRAFQSTITKYKGKISERNETMLV